MRKERSHASNTLKYCGTKRPVVNSTCILGTAWCKKLWCLHIFHKVTLIQKKERNKFYLNTVQLNSIHSSPTFMSPNHNYTVSHKKEHTLITLADLQYMAEENVWVIHGNCQYQLNVSSCQECTHQLDDSNILYSMYVWHSLSTDLLLTSACHWRMMLKPKIKIMNIMSTKTKKTLKSVSCLKSKNQVLKTPSLVIFVSTIATVVYRLLI